MRESHPPSPPPQNKKTVMPSHPTFNWYWKLQDKQGSTSLKKRSLVYSPNAPDVHGFLQPCYSRNLSKHSWQKNMIFQPNTWDLAGILARLDLVKCCRPMQCVTLPKVLHVYQYR